MASLIAGQCTYLHTTLPLSTDVMWHGLVCGSRRPSRIYPCINAFHNILGNRAEKIFFTLVSERIWQLSGSVELPLLAAERQKPQSFRLPLFAAELMWPSFKQSLKLVPCSTGPGYQGIQPWSLRDDTRR